MYFRKNYYLCTFIHHFLFFRLCAAMTQNRDTQHVFHSYHPAQGHGLAHDPIASLLGPRPIGWISTRSKAGHANLAPYSFFNIFNYKPPIVAFSSVEWKDTMQNVQDTGEFVLNLATRALAEAMNTSSATVAPEVDEFTLSGLTPLPSTLLAAPRVAESPASLECKLLNIQQLQGLDGQPVKTWMALGEVVAVHIRQDFLHDGVYDPAAAGHILRAGGPADYFEITDTARFRMRRPK